MMANAGGKKVFYNSNIVSSSSGNTVKPFGNIRRAMSVPAKGLRYIFGDNAYKHHSLVEKFVTVCIYRGKHYGKKEQASHKNVCMSG